jgi:hypothetical protein
VIFVGRESWIGKLPVANKHTVWQYDVIAVALHFARLAVMGAADDSKDAVIRHVHAPTYYGHLQHMTTLAGFGIGVSVRVVDPHPTYADPVQHIKSVLWRLYS